MKTNVLNNSGIVHALILSQCNLSMWRSRVYVRIHSKTLSNVVGLAHTVYLYRSPIHKQIAHGVQRHDIAWPV